MRTLKLNNDSFSLFQTWNELNRKQLRNVAKLVQSVDFYKFNVLLLLSVFNFKLISKKVIVIDDVDCFVLKKGRKKYIVSSEDINFITSHFEFLFTKIEDENKHTQYVINSKLTKNIIGSFNLGLRKYYGPADAITNLKFAEYIHSETQYANYKKYKDNEHLDKLVAVLFRKKKSFHFVRKYFINYDGDIRKKFNDSFIDRHSKKINRLNSDTKLAIVWYYEGCRWFLKTKFPNVFEGSPADEEKNTNTFESFLKLSNSLANEDVTKNEKIRNAYTYEVMVNMEQALIKHKKQKKDIADRNAELKNRRK